MTIFELLQHFCGVGVSSPVLHDPQTMEERARARDLILNIVQEAAHVA